MLYWFTPTIVSTPLIELAHHPLSSKRSQKCQKITVTASAVQTFCSLRLYLSRTWSLRLSIYRIFSLNLILSSRMRFKSYGLMPSFFCYSFWTSSLSKRSFISSSNWCIPFRKLSNSDPTDFFRELWSIFILAKSFLKPEMLCTTYMSLSSFGGDTS